jgi:flagellar motor component MotA
MLFQEFGSKLVGFTGEMQCSHCNNCTHMQVRQDYVKQSVLFIPIGTSHSAVFLICPTCETKTYVISFKTLFAGQNAKNKLIELLNNGRELTKHWVNQLSYKDREEALKRLNALKAHSLVKYLGTS